MPEVTAIILTKNEQLNLPDCVESLKKFAERIVIIDSGSTDNTVKIAEKMGCEVYYHPFENYSKQFNWGLDNADISTKWTLRLDADERLTDKLVEELNYLMQIHDNDEVNGITIEASLFFLGREIRHGGPQKRKLMLFKSGLGRIEDRRMDEHTVLNSGKAISAKNKFIHNDYKDITKWINKMNWYATREMQDYIEFKNGKLPEENTHDKEISKIRSAKFGIYYKFPSFIRCWLMFVYSYIFQLGFLDGKEGFIYHWMYHRWYRTLVDVKILEQRKCNKPFEKTGDLID